MPDVFTGKGTIPNLIQTSYDKMVEFNLRSEPMFRKFADKRPADLTNPGGSIVLQLHNDIDPVSSPLTNDYTDVNAVALNNTTKIAVTLDEWGNAVITTERLALEAISAIDPLVGEEIAFNMRDTLDNIVYNVLTSLATGRTNPDGSSGNETVLNGVDKTGETVTSLEAADIRRARAKLAGASVQTREGGLYTALIHPDVSFDLRSEAAVGGASVWQQPHTYTEAGVGNIWNGEVGVYEGVKFIESPRVKPDGDEYKTIILGRQALVEAVNYEPKTVIGPVTDKLMRFRPVGWKGLLGWNIYRPEARYVITSTSSIA
jgi:N4-gp56 family major capsid protein